MMNIEIDRQKKFYHFWEIVPGLLTWLSFLIPIVLSIFYPVVVACFVIVYAVYWLFKSMRMSYHLVKGYYKYKKDVQKDWLGMCKNLVKHGQSWRKIYHLVILATYKEELATLRNSLSAIAESEYPLDRIILVLATEERDKERAKKYTQILQKEFSGRFYHFMSSLHPQDIPGEVKGKGSNITFAGRCALEFIKQKAIPYENVMVTTLDADNRVQAKYFSNLTYKYLHTKNADHRSFQPLAMFFNNIWQVPLAIRSISVGSSFWQIIESTRPDRLRNFSAHSQSLSALVKTDFWSVKTIVEDGHQYWRSYLTFKGNYRVEPLYIPVYQDAVLSPSGYLDTFIEQYLQKRRWAWGCSDIPFVMTKIIPDKTIPFWDKWLQTARLVEGHFSWATTSVILACVGWMPLLLNPAFRSTVLAYNFPIIYSRLLTFAMIGLIVTLIISTLLLPSKPKKSLTWSVILEWLLSPVMLPISNILFSSLPAIDAQTRLMFGKYLEYRVTKKAVIKEEKCLLPRSQN